MKLFKPMTQVEFSRLSTFIEQEYGIKMPPTKKPLLESRLQKRLRALGMNTFGQYCDLLFSPTGQKNEVIYMIDLVTTNKTDFFREPTHFDYLVTEVLPEIQTKDAARKQVKIWSAGCSTGEEPYTLAMVMSEFSTQYQAMDFSILATDISTQVLEKAALAIYPEARIAGIPMAFKKKYFLKSKDRTQKTVRVVPALRAKVRFARLNFMDTHYAVNEQFDFIFCRNVLIYFDRKTQEQVINRLATKLRQGGYFFLGHSESIMDLDVPLTHIKPTIFRKI